jgi:cytochrome P450/NADPH-cytochrome P450 reductase
MIKLARQYDVWNLLQEGAAIYLCGDASRMAPDVEKSFVSLCQEKTGVSEQDAKTWMDGLKTSQRYLVDVWPRNS